jgi:hypothetical protein
VPFKWLLLVIFGSFETVLLSRNSAFNNTCIFFVVIFFVDPVAFGGLFVH